MSVVIPFDLLRKKAQGSKRLMLVVMDKMVRRRESYPTSVVQSRSWYGANVAERKEKEIKSQKEQKKKKGLTEKGIFCSWSQKRSVKPVGLQIIRCALCKP
jgi:hypothetical protein